MKVVFEQEALEEYRDAARTIGGTDSNVDVLITCHPPPSPDSRQTPSPIG